MKILQVNGYESPGRRFHGLSITPLLKQHGIESRHLVWFKDTDNPEVLTFGGKIIKSANLMIRAVERATSLQSVLYPHAKQMMKMPAFKEADLIHLHIIHSGFFSFAHLPMITAAKPTVWTLHDPWALTGHCIYPRNCKNWLNGCGNCPDLKTSKPLLIDTTRFLFNYKRKAYEQSNLTIIVASKWMHDMVKSSPMLNHATVHQIPFGLDLDFFSPTATPNAREKLGIADNALVITFRSDNNEFKGLPYILQALERIKAQQPIAIITLSRKPLKQQFNERFQVINLGWTNDEAQIRDAFVASDIFLMPSIAEAFGMMAIEALACAKPIIVFADTSLPEVTFSPDVGIAVPMRDGEALYHALQNLIDNPDERRNRGKKGREIAELHYDEKIHANRIAEIYKKVVNRAATLS
ncbi:MAG: glycosyltransferase [Gammaproteobacteria bacterium]|nr:glycosyltransferase [Gammaproteobacteria bacterium]